MRRWAVYVGASASLLVLAALPISTMSAPPARSGILVGLASGWVLQITAFAVLVAATARRAEFVVAGWAVGTFLRLAGLGLVAWLTLGGALDLPAEPTLIALAGATFVLLLLEPVFFHYRFGTR